MIPSAEYRWAICVKDGRDFLAGRFCFGDGNQDEPKTRTYPTREQARAALKTCCYRGKVVRVLVTITLISLEKD